MGKLVNPSAWHAGDPQFEPGWKQKDLSTISFLIFLVHVCPLPSFCKTGGAEEKQGTFKKISTVFEGLNFRRHPVPSWWVRYKDVPWSGRVSISVSMPACHAGELGSIPRRGGNIATPPASGWSPLFEFFFGSTSIVHCEKDRYTPRIVPKTSNVVVSPH